MEAESYANDETARLINAAFVPVSAHVKEHPAWFKRFDVPWTPTVLVLDADGKERERIEGYLTRHEFEAALLMALGRLAFMKKDWGEAEARYGEVVERYGDTHVAAEAAYWRGAAEYSRTHDHTVLGRTGEQVQAEYPDSIWAEKTLPWTT